MSAASIYAYTVALHCIARLRADVRLRSRWQQKVGLLVRGQSGDPRVWVLVAVRDPDAA
jgi:hypothetical protein